MGTQVKVQRDGRVIVATLDNPPHGLMTPTMVAELDALSLEAEADDEIGAVVLTGAHPQRFLAHYDVAALLAGAEGSPALSPRQARAIGGVVRGLERLPAVGPTLSKSPAAGMVELHAFHATLSRLGGDGRRLDRGDQRRRDGRGLRAGAGLRPAADQRRRHPRTAGDPAGLSPGGGGTQRLSRLIGRARALEIILEGRPVEAEEALAIGMVHRVVEPDQLLAVAVETAERLARRSKAAVAAVKRSVLEGGSMSLAAGIAVEQSEFMATIASAPSRRAMAAYVEHIERTGELPAYDEGLRDQLQDGTFVDMNAPD